MNILWGRPPAGGRNYVVQFFAWTFAWAPGLFTLTLGGARGDDRLVSDDFSDNTAGTSGDGRY
jgi:hypothetical protein